MVSCVGGEAHIKGANGIQTCSAKVMYVHIPWGLAPFVLPARSCHKELTQSLASSLTCVRLLNLNLELYGDLVVKHLQLNVF